MSIDLYNKNKVNNLNLMLIYKVGIFYQVYNIDAYILSYLTNYKVIKYKDYQRIGFPLHRLNAITRLLENKGIGYIVREEDSFYKSEVIDSKYFYHLNKCILELNKEDIIDIICFKLKSMSKESLEKLYFKLGINEF